MAVPESPEAPGADSGLVEDGLALVAHDEAEDARGDDLRRVASLQAVRELLLGNLLVADIAQVRNRGCLPVPVSRHGDLDVAHLDLGGAGRFLCHGASIKQCFSLSLIPPP